MRFSISVIILNWNRGVLLDGCIRSLLETSEEFDRCFVIDNNSSDNSAEIIRRHAAENEKIIPRLMPKNRGAEWMNEVMDEIDSDLVFILANDKQLKAGWREYVDAAFAAFPAMGQLALHAPAPLDDEVWVTKPATYASKDGVSIFVAQGNTGMSSVIRRSVLVDGNIHFRNLESDSEVKLPADGRLSAEIKERGYFSAWSNRYYCLNIGHTIGEFQRDYQYYVENYSAKIALKLEGLKKRLENYNAQPKPVRKSRIFQWSGDPESHDGTVDPTSRCWSTFGDGSSDLETVDFAYSLCRLAKPQRVGIFRGWSGTLAVAAGLAQEENGFGAVTCYEDDLSIARRMRELIGERQLSHRIDIKYAETVEEFDVLILAGFIPDITPAVHEFVLETTSKARLILVDPSYCRSPVFSEIMASPGLNRISFPTPRAISLLGR